MIVKFRLLNLLIKDDFMQKILQLLNANQQRESLMTAEKQRTQAMRIDKSRTSLDLLVCRQS